MMCTKSQNLRLWVLICMISLLVHTRHYCEDTVQQQPARFNSQQKPVFGGSIKSSATVFSVFSVDSHGAVGDGTSDDTQAFLAAWNAACTSRSNPYFLVPIGKTYHVKPINLKGPCKSKNLIAQISGNIVAPDDPATWNSRDPTLWLKFSNLQGITIQGGGTIDGSGQKWWENSCKTDTSKNCKEAPSAMTIDSSTQVSLRDLNFQNSQQKHLVIFESTNVQIENVQIVAPGDSPNTDGIHVYASQHVVIQNCIIGTGDDCISIVTKSSDVKINSLVCGPGHGISIGGLGKNKAKDTVSDVVVDGASLTSTQNGLRIKTWQGGSGSAKGISFQNVKMKNVSNPIIIDQYYCDSPNPCQVQKSAVQVSNVTYTDISGTSATQEAITVSCSKTVPCQNIVMKNIKLEMEDGGEATSSSKNVKGLRFVHVNPVPEH